MQDCKYSATKVICCSWFQPAATLLNKAHAWTVGCYLLISWQSLAPSCWCVITCPSNLVLRLPVIFWTNPTLIGCVQNRRCHDSLSASWAASSGAQCISSQWRLSGDPKCLRENRNQHSIVLSSTLSTTASVKTILRNKSLWQTVVIEHKQHYKLSDTKAGTCITMLSCCRNLQIPVFKVNSTCSPNLQHWQFDVQAVAAAMNVDKVGRQRWTWIRIPSSHSTTAGNVRKRPRPLEGQRTFLSGSREKWLARGHCIHCKCCSHT